MTYCLGLTLLPNLRQTCHPYVTNATCVLKPLQQLGFVPPASITQVGSEVGWVSSAVAHPDGPLNLALLGLLQHEAFHCSVAAGA
jgi:hypothetical protein